MSKDATIREIHHRVKNNLQTVAALLRLQARRIDSPEAKEALEEAVRRVGAIAVVHETLSQAPGEVVDLDEVITRVVALTSETASDHGPGSIRRSGSVGQLPADLASPLAMALTELLMNAVEHGLGRGGHDVVLTAEREPRRLRLVVQDDGPGLVDGFDLDDPAGGHLGLGLQIVRTLVVDDLGGVLVIAPAPGGSGTRACIEVPLRA
jgi:two-component sensor histidine kinase